ncbi:acyltransferase [Roseiconus nitratireducens]|uniref:Acyltransferase n=1 Tax=Roseiconus nitratireducens TaxID=2605748 RepID=A0A5M6CYV4_9BACT|nr:lysophospholipid acyltransferase family protein [Roseiconus nitratireducens]KAA5540293.1 acyltransferase [Roseiconus nitratireducens]
MRPTAPWFLDGFHRFLRPYLRRHFHAIAIESGRRPHLADIDPAVPMIIYANHPSWWDPLIAHFLNRSLFPGRQFHAPIDAEALEQYRVFEKLGFYGVRLSSKSGAAAFLRRSVEVIDQGNTALWLTPEGRFADARDHQAELMPGLAHLCTRIDSAIVLPLALEYVFWEERLPVCLVSLGLPIRVDQHRGDSKTDWSVRLTVRLRDTQTRLADLAIARSADPFDNLLRGTRGSGMAYDTFRRAKAWLTGQSYKAGHGDQFE